jgi:hypothetical protein
LTPVQSRFDAVGSATAFCLIGNAVEVVFALRKKPKIKIAGQATVGTTFFHNQKISLVFKRMAVFYTV